MKRTDGPLTERLRCDGTLLCRPAYDPTYLCTRCEGAEALEAAEATIAAIDALHRPDKNARCVVDWQPWPCADHRILHPEEGDQC